MSDIIKRKVAVIGSRDFTDKKLLYDVLTRNFDRIKLIISGGARGADTLGVQWAADYGIPYLVFPALWHDPFTGVYDKGAGFRRNRQIIEQCEGVIAFWDKKSAGTGHSIKMAQDLKKPIKIVEFTPEPDIEKLAAKEYQDAQDFLKYTNTPPPEIGETVTEPVVEPKAKLPSEDLL